MINKKGRIAITEIVILVVAIFALAWMVGSSIEVVSAADEDCQGSGAVWRGECSPNEIKKCGLSGDGSREVVYICISGVWESEELCSGICGECICVEGNDEPETPLGESLHLSDRSSLSP